MDATGLHSGDGGEGVQGEEPVQQTAGQQTARWLVSFLFSALHLYGEKIKHPKKVPIPQPKVYRDLSCFLPEVKLS